MFKPMLATAAKLDNDGHPVLTFPLYIQPKFDGIRASVVDGKLLTRTLKTVPNFEVYAALSQPEFNGLDGELIVGNPTAEDCYRKTASFCMSVSKTGAQWTYYVFDKWDHLGTFSERYLALIEQTNASVFCSPGAVATIQVVPAAKVENMDELLAAEQALVAAGHEGAIARSPSSPYKFGRASKTKGELVKIKRFVDFEAKVVGVYEENHNANVKVTNALGRSERSSHAAGKVGKNTLGGFVLRALNGPFEGVEFRCGTGLSTAERADLWAEWHDYGAFVGRVAAVKSFPVGAHERPRHPVFLGFRYAEDMPC